MVTQLAKYDNEYILGKSLCNGDTYHASLARVNAERNNYSL